MENGFFEHPILNSPYEYPTRHWELAPDGQPTQQIVEARRRAEFITPIPKPRKRRKSDAQEDFVFDEGAGVSTAKQHYEAIPIINDLRRQVDQWRQLPNPNDWLVTPETARLLQHWRHHQFQRHSAVFLPGRSGRDRHLAHRSRAEAREDWQGLSGTSRQCECRGAIRT